MNQEDRKPIEFGGLTLKPGKSYRVINSFRDYESNLHEPGECWEYLGCNVFPYDAGNTIYAKSQNGEELIIRMQYHEDAQESILESFSTYVAEA